MSELSCADEDHPLKLAESLPPSVKNETEGMFMLSQQSDKSRA